MTIGQVNESAWRVMQKDPEGTRDLLEGYIEHHVRMRAAFEKGDRETFFEEACRMDKLENIVRLGRETRAAQGQKNLRSAMDRLYAERFWGFVGRWSAPAAVMLLGAGGAWSYGASPFLGAAVAFFAFMLGQMGPR